MRYGTHEKTPLVTHKRMSHVTRENGSCHTRTNESHLMNGHIMRGYYVFWGSMGCACVYTYVYICIHVMWRVYESCHTRTNQSHLTNGRIMWGHDVLSRYAQGIVCHNTFITYCPQGIRGVSLCHYVPMNWDTPLIPCLVNGDTPLIPCRMHGDTPLIPCLMKGDTPLIPCLINGDPLSFLVSWMGIPICVLSRCGQGIVCHNIFII